MKVGKMLKQVQHDAKWNGYVLHFKISGVIVKKCKNEFFGA